MMNKINSHLPCHKHFSCLNLFILILITSLAFFGFESSASDNKDRFRTCNPAGGEGVAGQRVEVDGLKNLSLNKEETDAELEIDNPVCLGIILGSYAGVKIGIANMNRVCGTGSSIPRIKPSLIMDVKDLTLGGYKATTNTLRGDNRCLTAFGIASASFGILAAEMEVIYAIANNVYKNTSICGSN